MGLEAVRDNQGRLMVRWSDGCDVLDAEDYDWFLEHSDFQDEIHYTGETYCKLFDEIINKVKTQS